MRAYFCTNKISEIFIMRDKVMAVLFVENIIVFSFGMISGLIF